MTLHHQLDSLIVYDPDRSTSTVNVWVAHPSPHEEQALGTLFVVSAIDAIGKINHEVLSLLQEELKNQYYQAGDQRAESAFETALQRTNLRLHDLMREGVANWVSHSHILVGVLWRDQLFLTALGTVHAFLVRRDRLHDLLGHPGSAKLNPLRLFDHVVAGQVENNDRLLLCTPSLLDYFSMEKLRRTLLDHSPSQAARVLETTLLGVGPRLAFAALLLKLEATTVPSTTPSLVTGVNVRPAPQLSMEQLVHQERETENIMAPSVWPTVRDLGLNLIQAIQRGLRSILGRPVKRTIPGSQSAGTIRPMLTPAKSSSGTLAKPLFLPALVKRIQTAVGNWRPKIKVRPNIGQKPWRPSFGLTTWFDRLVRWYQALVLTQRRVVIVFLTLILIFSTAIVHTANQDTDQTDNPSTDDQVRSIESSLTQAEAALLFGGDDLARQHLTQAERILNELPTRRRSDREIHDRLTQALNALRDQVRRIIVITNPEVIVNLAPTWPDATPSQLYMADSRYLIFDSSTGTVISGLIGDSTEPIASQNTLDTGKLQTGALVGLSRLIFTTDRGNIVEYSISDQTWRPLDSRFPNPQPYIQSLSVFQSRLYALDPAHDQVYRFSLSSASLGTGQGWLRETVDLADTRAAVVDGSVWFLQPGGQVEEYFSGRRTEFTPPDVDPALTNPTRLWTNEESKYLYLLDPESKRVVVYDKDGRLVSQYQSNNWTNLRDVNADENDDWLYVISGTTLYRTPLSASSRE